MAWNKAKPAKEQDFSKKPVTGKILEIELVRTAGKNASERLKLVIVDAAKKSHNIYLSMLTWKWTPVVLSDTEEETGATAPITDLEKISWVAAPYSEYGRLKYKAFEAGVELLENIELSAFGIEQLKLPKLEEKEDAKAGVKYRKEATHENPYFDIFNVAAEPEIEDYYIKLGVDSSTYTDKKSNQEKKSENYMVEYFGADVPEGFDVVQESKQATLTDVPAGRAPKSETKPEAPAKTTPAATTTRAPKNKEPEKPAAKPVEPETPSEDTIESEFFAVLEQLAKDCSPLAISNRALINCIDETGRDRFDLFSDITKAHFKDPSNIDEMVDKFITSGKLKADGKGFRPVR
jgi:hypothetical protein